MSLEAVLPWMSLLTSVGSCGSCLTPSPRPPVSGPSTGCRMRQTPEHHKPLLPSGAEQVAGQRALNQFSTAQCAVLEDRAKIACRMAELAMWDAAAGRRQEPESRKLTEAAKRNEVPSVLGRAEKRAS